MEDEMVFPTLAKALSYMLLANMGTIGVMSKKTSKAKLRSRLQRKLQKNQSKNTSKRGNFWRNTVIAGRKDTAEQIVYKTNVTDQVVWIKKTSGNL